MELMCNTFNIVLFKAPSLISKREVLLLVDAKSFMYFPIHRRNIGWLNRISKRESMLLVHVVIYIFITLTLQIEGTWAGEIEIFIRDLKINKKVLNIKSS